MSDGGLHFFRCAWRQGRGNKPIITVASPETATAKPPAAIDCQTGNEPNVGLQRTFTKLWFARVSFGGAGIDGKEGINERKGMPIRLTLACPAEQLTQCLQRAVKII